MDKLDIGYVDSWDIMYAKEIHPSHLTAIIKVKELLKYINKKRDDGNLIGKNGFSAALFLSELIKELEDENGSNNIVVG